MLGDYGWAFMKPVRKLYYNMTITFVSVMVALVIGGTEALALVNDQLRMQGTFWDTISSLNNNFGTIGLILVGVFVVSWVASIIIYRLNRFDEIEVNTVSVRESN